METAATEVRNLSQEESELEIRKYPHKRAGTESRPYNSHVGATRSVRGRPERKGLLISSRFPDTQYQGQVDVKPGRLIIAHKNESSSI